MIGYSKKHSIGGKISFQQNRGLIAKKKGLKKNLLFRENGKNGRDPKKTIRAALSKGHGKKKDVGRCEKEEC